MTNNTPTAATKNPSTALVVLAFATVYLVWGSTYFFIAKAVHEIPALLMGAIRFITSGLIMMAWCAYRKEKLWNWQQVKVAAITGLLLLLVGNGAVIWAEKELPSSLVAVLVSTSPIWFVLLDKPKWQENLRSRTTLLGLAIGFVGVVMLFKEKLSHALASNGSHHELWGLIILVIGSLAWAGGSIYSKYHATGSSSVASAWQMLVAGAAFSICAAVNHEYRGFDPAAVSLQGWGSVLYLVTMGSLAGYSAYVWLLQVRPATQVSTYAYVNPVVAVLLGTLLAGEHMSLLQIAGLAVILTSVLLINLSKYRQSAAPPAVKQSLAKPA